MHTPVGMYEPALPLASIPSNSSAQVWTSQQQAQVMVHSRIACGDVVAESRASPQRAWLMLLPDAISRGRATGQEGIRLFGFTNRRVVQCVQQLPNASRCEHYACWPDGMQPERVRLVSLPATSTHPGAARNNPLPLTLRFMKEAWKTSRMWTKTWGALLTRHTPGSSASSLLARSGIQRRRGFAGPSMGCCGGMAVQSEGVWWLPVAAQKWFMLVLCWQTVSEQRARAKAEVARQQLPEGIAPQPHAPLEEDRCEACGTDEESEDNLLLQCDGPCRSPSAHLCPPS